MEQNKQEEKKALHIGDVNQKFLPDNVNTFDEYVEYLSVINNGSAKGRLCDLYSLHDEIMELVEYDVMDAEFEDGKISWNKLSKFITDKVSSNFEPKKCMPDGIASKEEHEEYLKAIGYEKYVKDLEYFKDSHVGLYVIDKMIDDIFTDTPEEKDCKTVVEAYLVQQFKRLKSLMWRIS